MAAEERFCVAIAHEPRTFQPDSSTKELYISYIWLHGTLGMCHAVLKSSSAQTAVKGTGHTTPPVAVGPGRLSWLAECSEIRSPPSHGFGLSHSS